jgi:hypothetical protein
MDDDANIIDVRFCKSAIHSVASLTYDDVRTRAPTLLLLLLFFLLLLLILLLLRFPFTHLLLLLQLQLQLCALELPLPYYSCPYISFSHLPSPIIAFPLSSSFLTIVFNPFSFITSPYLPLPPNFFLTLPSFQFHSIPFPLPFPQAQKMLDDPTCNDKVGTSVKLLNKLARILRQRRIDQGALTLASPEVKYCQLPFLSCPLCYLVMYHPFPFYPLCYLVMYHPFPFCPLCYIIYQMSCLSILLCSLYLHIPCYPILCCAVLCCAVLCCAVLCCAVLFQVKQFHPISYHLLLPFS